MDENAMDESEATALQRYESDEESVTEDNENLLSAGVLCLTHLFTIFRRPGSQEPEDDADWEVPFDLLQDLSYLGSGAHGVVFSGTLRGEMVAVKKMTDSSETNIRHLKKLRHDNVVRFHGICSQPPHYCVIMEYCQYGPLFSFLHNGASLGTHQTMTWIKMIVDGMAYLHGAKIIHRDLKSPNVLVGDNLVVKVSDFGTSREWDTVSAVMSFTGTVAWMAPEMIRHEPCSERVDVWSFGVVIWEMLTQEIPYKNMESHAIMWGVGTNLLFLPVPTTVPESMRHLLAQCWSRTPRNRPTFTMILGQIETATEDMESWTDNFFTNMKDGWRREIQECMERQRNAEQPLPEQELELQRRNVLRNSREARQLYEQQMSRANDIYMEVCAIRLQLEERERALAELERAHRNCRCNGRRAVHLPRRRSSSSDVPQVHLQNTAPASQRRNGTRDQSSIIVNFYEGRNGEAVTFSVLQNRCVYPQNTARNNNRGRVQIEEIVDEDNGNDEVGATSLAYQRDPRPL